MTLGLICKSGARICDGCGECKAEADGVFCERCGERVPPDETYGDLFYGILCLGCLMKLHKN